MQKTQSLWHKVVFLSLLSTSLAAKADDGSAGFGGTNGPAWQGLYTGVNGGGGTSSKGDVQSQWGDVGHKAKGSLAGVHLGYNWRLSPMAVVGIENDFDAANISTGSDDGLSPEVKIGGLFNGRVRGGILVLDQRLLLYVTAGVAAGQVNDGGVKAWRVGETGGLGAEWAWTPQWSTRIEVLGTDLSKGLHHDNWGDTHAKFETVTLGMNFHF